MIRIILLGVAFFSATGALLWGLNAYPDKAVPAIDQVSRTAPDPLGLQPSLAAATAPLTPAVTAVEPPAPAAVKRLQPAAAPQPVVAAPAPAVEPEMDIVRKMSLGIVQELQKPVANQPAPVQAAKVAPQAVATRSHVVQPGDSLPGIAFRYYGTTVAYLQILQANPDVLSDPSELTAGMVLRLPETR